MTRWFRFYDDVVNDPKVQMLPGETFKVWVNLLCIASKEGGKLPALKALAFMLRPISVDELGSLLNEFCELGLLDPVEVEGAPMSYEPHNWGSRQYKSDSSAERMREHRKRHGDGKSDKPRDVTSDAGRDVTVTVQNRSRSRDRTEQSKSDGGRVERERAPVPKQIDLEEAIAAVPASPRKSLISEDAFTIATEVLQIMGKDAGDPLSVGAPMTVQSWINGNLHRDSILAGVRLGMQSRGGNAPGTLKYFEKAIARAHADLTAAPNLPVAQPGENYHVQASTRSPVESLGAVANRLADAGIDFGPRPTGLRNPQGRATPEPVPAE